MHLTRFKSSLSLQRYIVIPNQSFMVLKTVFYFAISDLAYYTYNRYDKYLISNNILNTYYMYLFKYFVISLFGLNWDVLHSEMSRSLYFSEYRNTFSLIKKIYTNIFMFFLLIANNMVIPVELHKKKWIFLINYNKIIGNMSRFDCTHTLLKLTILLMRILVTAVQSLQ